jgi:hypothetical protein
LLIHLLEPADLSRQDLNLIDNTARSETDVAVTLLDGKADAGGYRHRGRGAPVSA